MAGVVSSSQPCPPNPRSELLASGHQLCYVHGTRYRIFIIALNSKSLLYRRPRSYQEHHRIVLRSRTRLSTTGTCLPSLLCLERHCYVPREPWVTKVYCVTFFDAPLDELESIGLNAAPPPIDCVTSRRRTQVWNVSLTPTNGSRQPRQDHFPRAHLTVFDLQGPALSTR